MPNRFLSLPYWAESNLGPLTLRGQIIYLLPGSLFLAGLLWSLLIWRQRVPSSLAWAVLSALCMSGAVAVALRLLRMPVVSACIRSIAQPSSLLASWPSRRPSRPIGPPSMPTGRRSGPLAPALRPLPLSAVRTLFALHALALARLRHPLSL